MDNAFRVDPVQGTVEVASALDRQRTSEFILTVRATDRGQPPRHSEVHVNIVVTLPDNAPPRFERVSGDERVNPGVRRGRGLGGVDVVDMWSGLWVDASRALVKASDHIS